MIRTVGVARHVQRRAVPLMMNHQARTVSTAPKNWMERLLSVPKGWEKFYRKPGNSGKGSENPGGTGSGGPKNSKSEGQGNKSGGGGGGGGKKPDPGDAMNHATKIAVFVGTSIFLTLILNEMSGNGREISWHDFQSQLLESGNVDRIIVTNKNIARVVLRKPLDPYASTAPASDIYNPFAQKAPAGKDLRNDDPTGYRPPSEYNMTAHDSPPQGEFAGAAAGPNHSRYPSIGSPNPSSTTSAPYYFNIGTVDSFERKLEEAQRALGIASKDYIPVIYVSETSIMSTALNFAPTLLLIGAMIFMTRGMGGSGGGGPGNIFKIGKSTAKRVNKESVTTTFADVAGCDEAKREIMEFVQFLKDPKRFTDLGAKIPKGALLCGPPGTGKTLLAKATAGEANVPFFSISGSDFVEMFVGVGPSRVRDLFKEARENAPCILFIDEIDAVGRQRGKGGMSGGNDERENTLNQLLVEMDGFDPSTNIVILAGTNRVDVLDQALTRPGRFDRQIQVDKPDIKGRKAIFDVYLKNITLDGSPELYSGRLAALTPGFVGADIANICNEAAIMAARRDKKKVDMLDFESATERIIGGLESKKIMSVEERRVVAYHEAGHAVAGWNLEFADPLLKVTIVPRGNGALGFAQYLPKELFLRTREQILDIVCMALAGRAAEQVFFGRVTTGAADDLRRVTQIVYQMVQVYGMNERVGQVAFPKEEGQWPQDRMYSNATAEVMDEEVRLMVDEAYKRTIALMTERKEQVQKVAELLLEKETITNMDVTELIGARKWSAGKEYDEYVNSGWMRNMPNGEADKTEEESKDTPVDATLAPV